MTSRFLFVLVAVAALTGMKPAVAQQPPAQPRARPNDLVLKPAKGDFDVMLERRRVRVLAPYSRTFFFNEMGRERGYSADLVRVVEQHLNATLGKQLGRCPLTSLIIPTTRDKLLTGVVERLGDIAVNVGVSEQFRKAGKPPVNIMAVPDALEDEDMMEMLNLGILQIILVDD